MALNICTEAIVRFIFHLLRYSWENPGTLIIIGIVCIAAAIIFRNEILLGAFISVLNLLAKLAGASTGGILFFLAAIPLGIMTGALWAMMVLSQAEMNAFLRIPAGIMAFFLGFARTLLPLPFIDLIFGFILRVRVAALAFNILCLVIIIVILFSMPLASLLPFATFVCDSVNTVLLWFN